MPARTGKANNQQSTVEGNFYRVYSMFLGERQYKQGFVGDEYWSAWVSDEGTRSFSYKPNNQADMLMTLRRESRSKGQFWYAYKKGLNNKLHKVYVGKSEDLTGEKLAEAASAMHIKITGKEPRLVAFGRAAQVTQSAPMPQTEQVFLPDYQTAPTHKQVPQFFALTNVRRDVLAAYAAGLNFAADYAEGKHKRKIAREIAEAGLLAEVTGYVDHRKHNWRLTDAGLKLIRKDEDLQRRVSLHK